MLKNNEILETISMIKEQNLDVRTITLGLSLMDCACEDVKVLSEKIYDKITKTAENLVKTGEDIEKRFGIPIINKRISVTPISIVAASCNCNSYLDIAKAMDKAAKEVGVDFIGGFSALVHKGFTNSDLKLIKSLPESLANTDIVCSSVNIGSTRYGINMDAVKLMGETIKETSLNSIFETLNIIKLNISMPINTLVSYVSMAANVQNIKQISLVAPVSLSIGESFFIYVSIASTNFLPPCQNQ